MWARTSRIDHKSITCYMLGEHGNLQFAPWSCVSFRGMPLDAWAETDERFRFDRMALQEACVLGANGVEQVIELPLSEEERAQFHSCCEGIRRNMQHLKEL